METAFRDFFEDRKRRLTGAKFFQFRDCRWSSLMSYLNHEKKIFLTETAVLHAGYRHDPVTNAIAVPIYQTTAYELSDDLAGVSDIYNVKRDGFTYTRIINPTTRVLERRYARVEGAADALAVASGQAATFLALMNLSSGRPGDNIVTSRYLYGNSWNLLFNTFKRLGIEARSADPRSQNPSSGRSMTGP